MLTAFYPYQLVPKVPLRLGAKSILPRSGALLKFFFKDLGQEGHADCFPWPERGDLLLDRQLELLHKGELTPLTQSSLAFAREEAQAKKENRSVFLRPDGSFFPPLQNHFLLPCLDTESPQVIEKQVKEEGYRLIKIKLGGEGFQQQTELLQGLLPAVSPFSCRFRFDFNRLLSVAQFEVFLKETEPYWALIDFIEDPMPYEPFIWKKFLSTFPIRLALDEIDFGKENDLEETSFSVLILKPACQNWEVLAQKWKKRVPLVVTSSLDHPLGQLSAAWAAYQLQQDPEVELEACGLQSQRVYEPTDFSKALVNQGPFLCPLAGRGWGMDVLLDSLPWIKQKRENGEKKKEVILT